MAGVAKLTMHSAVQELKSRGVLASKQGRWIELAPAAAAAFTHSTPLAPTNRDAWAECSRRIVGDLINGRFAPHEPLPGVKELTSVCGVSPYTLKKALRELGRQHWLVRRGRAWWPSGDQVRSTGRIVLIARGNATGELSLYQPWAVSCLMTLEEECGRRGNIALETCPIYYLDTGMRCDRRLTSLLDGKDDGDVLGYLFWTTAVSAEMTVSVLERLALCGKPVAVLQEQSFDPSQAAILAKRNPAMAFFNISNGLGPGRDLGRYLMAGGHTACAYFSVHHDSPWSRRRYDGLNRTYTDAGLRGRVHRLASQPPVEYHRGGPFNPNAAKALTPLLSTDLAALNDGHRIRERAFRHLIYGLDSFWWVDTVRRLVRPMAEAALARNVCSAWVAETDIVAFVLLDALENAGRNVPGDISVVSFDNSYQSFLYGLTSYDFNAPAAFRAMIDHLLHPYGKRGLPGAGGAVEIEGFLRIRSSSSKAPRPC